MRNAGGVPETVRRYSFLSPNSSPSWARSSKPCPLLPDYGGEGCSELARAALGWAIAFQSAQDIALQFATVARDGCITQDELPAAQTIRAKAVELRRIMEETIAAIDKATSGQTKD